MQQIGPCIPSLHQVGKPVGIILFVALLLVVAPHATAETVSNNDAMLLGFELGMGRSIDGQLSTLIGPPTTLPPAHKTWVETVFRDLVAQTSRRDIRYLLRILDSEMVNAFSAPGGFIYLTTGLIDHLGNHTDALANVIGHELAHVELKHGLDHIMRSMEVGLWVIFGGDAAQQNEVWERVDQMGAEVFVLGWGRNQELEADALGQRMTAAAGYDPYGMVDFLALIELVDRIQEEETDEWVQTHPLTPERKQRARVLAESLEVAERRRPKPTPPDGLPDLGNIIGRLKLHLLSIEQGEDVTTP